MCQIVKVIIAMETGLIPPNINFTQVQKGVKTFEDESIRVVTNTTPWTSGFMGINSFGFGGANCHILMRSNTMEKINKRAPNDNLPRLVVLSGRTEQAVESFLNEVGLIDLLRSVSIVSDYVVGHSIGELCCAYAAGNFTLEQVILSSYYIGLGLKETKKINCAMVNIGLSYENVKNICLPDIEVIYSNSQNTCSISGLKKLVRVFTKQLEATNVFTEEVNCCDNPLHTCYLLPAKATILAYLFKSNNTANNDSQSDMARFILQHEIVLR
ncbi:fatty acid synthase-like [Linepithema humile]|uniref:fatty acid synthase-like n=1 Tax=Linepithema humile TaxID=83485 RepID=UPI00351E2B36